MKRNENHNSMQLGTDGASQWPGREHTRKKEKIGKLTPDIHSKPVRVT
jgi:hypothetical protein